MNVCLIMPDFYTLSGIVKNGFTELGYEVYFLDYRKKVNKVNKLLARVSKLNPKLNNKYNFKIKVESNLFYFKKIEEIKPKYIFVYNSEMLDVETLKKIRQMDVKIIFLLGDNPLYTFTNNENLSLLFHADVIISADSFFTSQLKQIGLKNIFTEYLGYDKRSNYIFTPGKAEKEMYSNDLFFVGRSYPNSWGYKRMLFLDQFNNLDIKIYANSKSWKYWVDDFPLLKNKITYLKHRITHEKINTISNCCKIYPIDMNPGIINGIHLRVFECIGSGILPIVEYRKDIDTVFRNIELPTIKKYGEGEDLANYYLKNENERIELVSALKAHLDKYYNAALTMQKVIDRI